MIRSAIVLVAVLGSVVPVAAQDEPPPPPTQPEPAAQPEPPPDAATLEARERIARASELFERGNFDAALAEFSRIYDLLEGRPTRYIVLYNIGQCHERLFQYDLALDAYQRYLDEGGPQANAREMVIGTMRALEGLLGTIEVSTNVARAEVWSGDRRIGEAPGSVRVPGGRHTIELRARGYVSSRVEVEVPARGTRAVRVSLDRLADEYRGISPVFFWTSGAVAAASALGGAIFGVLALQARAEVDDAIAAGPTSPDRWRVGADDQDHVRRLAITADVFFGGAVLFGAASVLLYFLTDWSEMPPSRPHFGRGPSLEVAW